MDTNMEKEYGNLKFLLPVYILVDTSYSMLNEKIESVKVALQVIKKDLAEINLNENIDTEIRISVMSFNDTARWLCELALPDAVTTNQLSVTGCTAMGKAFDLLETALHSSYMRQHVSDVAGFMHPVVIILTDGMPTDYDNGEFSSALNKLKLNNWFVTAQRHAFACYTEPKEADDVKLRLAEFTGTPRAVYEVNNDAIFQYLLPYITKKTSQTNSQLGSSMAQEKWDSNVAAIEAVAEKAAQAVPLYTKGNDDIDEDAIQDAFADFGQVPQPLPQ